MTDKKKAEKSALKTDTAKLLQEMKEFALTVGEDCPEGHRRNASSGACLPIGSTDHTAFTRSVNEDHGNGWRGLDDKPNKTFASENKESALLDAGDMDEPVSCGEGTTFSFVRRACVSLEEAELENADELEDEDSEALLSNEDASMSQPEGRRDTPNHACPPDQFFDYKRRECIPLNKDTVMASEDVDQEFKELYASHLSGRLAMTSPDPLDGHTHLVTVDADGNGKTSVASTYMGGESYYHSHDVKGYVVKDFSEGDYTSKHFGFAIPKDMWQWESEEERNEVMSQPSVYSSEDAEFETLKTDAAPIKTKQRNALPSGSFGVPGKRKFPLDSCNRVRNAMARFNQAKGLTASEKATLRRKIMTAAKKCGVEIKNFTKATTAEEFATVLNELLLKERIVTQYAAKDEEKKDSKKGPCPPWMSWDPKAKKCGKMKGFYEIIKSQAQAMNPDPTSKDPEGRKDTPGFKCPEGQFFDFKNRKCIPLDSSAKSAEEDAASKDLSPSPAGRPARLPQDCPKGTIWDADLEDCKPLDSRKKTKSADEEGGAANGPGKEKDGKGCAPGEFMNPITKKCMPRKGAFKGKSTEETAVNAMPGNREGLTDEVPGKVKLPSDCPPNTIWDGANRMCKPLTTVMASVENMTIAQLIQQLDEIIQTSPEQKEKSKVAAKELPNEAFPPSLVSSTHRSLMHHTPEVADAYDNETVDVSRLRNSLARVDKVEGYSAPAVADAKNHLLYHAREVVKSHLEKS